MMKRKYALWLGRFQPPTIAHLITVKTILKEWNKLIIGIVHRSPRPDYVDPKWEIFLRRTAKSTLVVGKNPFTTEEVARMWTACLREQYLESKVNIKSMPQIAYQPRFNEEFDPKKVDFIEVTLTEDDTEIDKDREYAFSHLIGRPIFYVSPPFKLHNTDIRSLVLRGGHQWEEFIPVGAYTVFTEIDGPRRMAETQ
ncbi:MAG: hypothetical protein Q7S37_02930 [bacterium]|nr:hypothetical protein [bacterium]